MQLNKELGLKTEGFPIRQFSAPQLPGEHQAALGFGPGGGWGVRLDKWVSRHGRKCPPGGAVCSGPTLWPCPPCPQLGGAPAESGGRGEGVYRRSQAPILEPETVTSHVKRGFASVTEQRFWRLREIILDYPDGPKWAHMS